MIRTTKSKTPPRWELWNYYRFFHLKIFFFANIPMKRYLNPGLFDVAPKSFYPKPWYWRRCLLIQYSARHPSELLHLSNSLPPILIYNFHKCKILAKLSLMWILRPWFSRHAIVRLVMSDLQKLADLGRPNYFASILFSNIFLI